MYVLHCPVSWFKVAAGYNCKEIVSRFLCGLTNLYLQLGVSGMEVCCVFFFVCVCLFVVGRRLQGLFCCFISDKLCSLLNPAKIQNPKTSKSLN